eukprot:4127727-Pyramimonas_sp.AAC.1
MISAPPLDPLWTPSRPLVSHAEASLLSRRQEPEPAAEPAAKKGKGGKDDKKGKKEEKGGKKGKKGKKKKGDDDEGEKKEEACPVYFVKGVEASVQVGVNRCESVRFRSRGGEFAAEAGNSRGGCARGAGVSRCAVTSVWAGVGVGVFSRDVSTLTNPNQPLPTYTCALPTMEVEKKPNKK